MESTLVLIGSGSLVCLMPLAIYLLYVSNLNSKPNPVMVSGTWDFTAVLLGLSGFLLLSGPVLLTMIDSRWRSQVYGNWYELRTLGAREARAWSMMSFGYFLLLVGIIPGIIRSRRSVTSIYNLDANILAEALDEAFRRTGIDFIRQGLRFTVKDKKTGVPMAETSIESFRAMNHSSLKWSGEYTETRSLIEVELEKLLRSYISAKLAMAGWLNTAAMTVMLVMLFWTVTLVVMVAFSG